MAGTFLDELARLNQQNFLGGIAEGAQAMKEQRQNARLSDLYNEFRGKLPGLQTTEQQVSELNKAKVESVDFNKPDAVDKFADMSAKAMGNYSKLLDQSDAYANLYQPYITAFATLGDEGVRVASTLSKELDQKKQSLEQKAKIPMMELEYENALMTKANNALQLASGQVKLDELKQDVAAKDLLSKIVSSDIGNQVFKFDESTGKTNFNKHDMYMKLQKIYGNQPEFGKAWLMLEDFMYKNLQKYDSARMINAMTARANAKGSNAGLTDATLSAYKVAEDMSRNYGRLTYGNDTMSQAVRKAYFSALGETGDIKNMQLGADKGVIAKVQDTDGIPASDIKKELEYVNKHFYDKSSDEYYWDYIKVLENNGRAGGWLRKDEPLTYSSQIRIGDVPLSAKNLLLNVSPYITTEYDEKGTGVTKNKGGWNNPAEPPTYYTGKKEAEQYRENAKKKGSTKSSVGSILENQPPF